MIKAHTRQKGFKKSRLATAEQISKRSKQPNKLLMSKPDCPKELLYLWALYNDILKGCTDISYVDIAAYKELTGRKLKHWEVDLMINIDIIRRKAANEDI